MKNGELACVLNNEENDRVVDLAARALTKTMSTGMDRRKVAVRP